MKLRGKLMGNNLKFGRCPVSGHGQWCEVTREMRRPGIRADDLRDYRRELRLAILEDMER